MASQTYKRLGTRIERPQFLARLTYDIFKFYKQQQLRNGCAKN